MPSRRATTPEPLTDEERATLETQTRRNLDAMELEQAGQTEQAVALYEQNVTEGFDGVWPYSRLASMYERQLRYEDATRVLTRALEVAKTSKRRPTADRRSIVQGIQGRLRLLRKTAQAAKTRTGTPGRSFVPLPMADG